MIKTTREGPPPPRPAILDRPAIVIIKSDPIIVSKEGGSR